MISLEKARALKEAGLRWEPKRFDLFTGGTETWEVLETYIGEGGTKWIRGIGGWVAYGKNFTFLPRLDQLLAEIERRGWVWYIGCAAFNNKYYCQIGKVYKNEDGHIVGIDYTVTPPDWFKGDTPEDAAAETLLWILKGELHG